MNDDYIEVDTDALNTAGQQYAGTADTASAIVGYVRDNVQEYGRLFSPPGDEVGDTIRQNLVGPAVDLLDGLDAIRLSLHDTGSRLRVMGRTAEHAETASTEVAREIQNGYTQRSTRREPSQEGRQVVGDVVAAPEYATTRAAPEYATTRDAPVWAKQRYEEVDRREPGQEGRQVVGDVVAAPEYATTRAAPEYATTRDAPVWAKQRYEEVDRREPGQEGRQVVGEVVAAPEYAKTREAVRPDCAEPAVDG